MNRREILVGIGAAGLTAAIPFNTKADNLRQIYRLTSEPEKDTTWVQVRMNDLRKGDIFQLFDPDGQVGDEWLAGSDPYLTDNVWGIEAEPFTRKRHEV